MERCARWSSTSPAARCRPRELPDPRLDPGRPGEVLVEVHACGVCRTDLHIRDGEVRGSRLPVVPGHQIVATVLAGGPDAEHEPGARVGIPWLGWTDGTCRFCTSGRENLCERAAFTGLDRDGGYATHAVADGATPSRCPRASATSRRRRCCAPGSSGTARCA